MNRATKQDLANYLNELQKIQRETVFNKDVAVAITVGDNYVNANILKYGEVMRAKSIHISDYKTIEENDRLIENFKFRLSVVLGE